MLVRTCAHHARVLTCVYLSTGPLKGYPILTEEDKALIPGPDEKYAAESNEHSLVNGHMRKPQPKMPFMRSGSVDGACTRCKEDNDYPIRTVVPFKGKQRPFTNIPQVLYKFHIVYVYLCVC